MPLSQSGSFRSSLPIRLAVTAIALLIWFGTQALIGARGAPAAGIADGIHTATAAENLYLHQHPGAANLLLAVSSAIIDLLGIFLLSRWIFRSEPRPFLGLVIVLGLRQIMQALVALPAPPDAIWHSPAALTSLSDRSWRSVSRAPESWLPMAAAKRFPRKPTATVAVKALALW